MLRIRILETPRSKKVRASSIAPFHHQVRDQARVDLSVDVCVLQLILVRQHVFEKIDPGPLGIGESMDAQT